MWCTCVHLEDILRSSVFSFPPSWIWAIRVSSHSQSHELPKWSLVIRTMFRTEWTKCVSTNGLVALSNIHYFKPRSNTARKYWSPTRLFVIRKIFWMYLYRNCLQRYTKFVAFLKLNDIKKKLSSLCQILAGNFFPQFARSAKSSRHSLETRDWREFSLLMRREYKK